ncbi:hypothetical protein [Streptomyces sp. HUAS TT20]|uniref:hypothetical protein n=1 Tax=Streptomyces sp. HUAS TT20 TaxID=3447509 RepID=UPI0021D979DD|nr:hypothetical protein [Streptomyces sp. HUAS 15-9]UXY27503.1 hypothetical protein N8I87_13515 [Streptomyces sp. HUAS 15-9]
MTRQVTLRLSDEHAEILDRLAHGGRNANETLRAALVAYDALCRDAHALRAVGAPGGLIQVETHLSAEGFTFEHKRPLVGRKDETA